MIKGRTGGRCIRDSPDHGYRWYIPRHDYDIPRYIQTSGSQEEGSTRCRRMSQTLIQTNKTELRDSSGRGNMGQHVLCDQIPRKTDVNIRSCKSFDPTELMTEFRCSTFIITSTQSCSTSRPGRRWSRYSRLLPCRRRGRAKG
jgi:hypothetical protein